ncbi:MAG: dTMP kinase [Candidatus Hydrogenedentes bacterium]|nr:dTMP kinase [Candidatus Hydrogenedentota bacterium]
MKGRFITLEGVEGCGKTTQINQLKKYLENRGYPVDVTREPGGTPLAEAIRGLLLNPANHAMAAATELFLYEAARAQHVAERIRPGLQAGKIILSDRYADSTTAYQGAGRGFPKEIVERLHEVATQGTSPDLTILLDVPVEEGLSRVSRLQKSDRLEQEPVEFHRKVRAEFLRLAEAHPERIKVVDGTRHVEEVSAEIRKFVDALLDQK